MNVWVKSLLYLVIFSALHFGYQLTGWDFLIPFCGVNESVFQHLKMAFWGYLFVSVGEYFIVRKRISDRVSFFYSRLFSTIVLPYFTMLIWYLAPAILGKLEPLMAEVLWAIFATYISAVFIGTVERNTMLVKYSAFSKIVLIALFLVSAFLYVRFTYKLPWIDLFVDPARL